MAKRLRDFKRLSFTARTGEVLQEFLVDRTLNEHYARICVQCNVQRKPDADHCKKCGETKTRPKHECCGDDLTVCVHEASGNLDVARLVEANLKIGKKRAILDLPDPYCVDDSAVVIDLLHDLGRRLVEAAGAQKAQVMRAIHRVSKEVFEFAERSPLFVLAEIAVGED